MSGDTPPIVLTFGLSDPTGASGIQADLLTLASMGCHAATVLTGYAIRDSANCDEVTALDPEIVVSQARMLLEDMPIAAFKIGASIRAEIVSAIAEVVSDYDDVPLILASDFTIDDEHMLSADELRDSITGLLAPQTTVLVASYTGILQMAQTDADGEAVSFEVALEQLLSQGCEYVLATDSGTHQIVNTLYGEEGRIRQDLWDRGPHRILGLGDTLAAAIAALLANGLEPAEAVREAQEYLFQASRFAFRPGMGSYIPDRLFWAKTVDDDAIAGSGEMGDLGAPSNEVRH
jgi:hydroxymethylpyrimidine/phosphomethylpyrimidine kinase